MSHDKIASIAKYNTSIFKQSQDLNPSWLVEWLIQELNIQVNKNLKGF